MPIGSLAALGGGAATSLIVHLIAKDKFSKVFGKAESKMGKLGKVMLGLGKTALVAGAGMAVGIGIKAVSAAAKFEKSMANVATLVDTSTENMTKMGKKVRELAKKIPVDLGELTEALYQVRSAGIDAGSAMEVLESAGKLAVAGLGTTTEATDLLTSAFNVFAKQGYDSARMADILFKTVKAGKTTVAELAMSFGMVAPLAGELNVKLTELQAATAALTTTGMKASVAQSQLRAAMSNLMKPTKEMRELMDRVGVSTAKQLIETYGLVGGLEKLRDASEGNAEMFAKAMGSIEGLNAALFLTGEGAESFTGTLKDMETGTEALTEAFEKQTETAHAQWQIVKTEINDAFIELGTIILPEVVKLIKDIAPALQGLLMWITENMDKIMAPFSELGNVLAGIAEQFRLLEKYGVLGIIRPGYYRSVEREIEMRGEALEEKLMEQYRRTKGVEIRPGVFKYPTREEIREEWEEMMKGRIKPPRIAPDLFPGAQKGGTVIAPLGTPVPIMAHGGETIVPAGRRLGNIFNFDFSGAFIGDIETFKREIMDLINRESELRELGGE